jgi:hypothetical protein
MAEPGEEDLAGLVRALKDELGTLRGEVSSLRGEVERLRGAAPAPDAPSAPAAPSALRAPSWLTKPLWPSRPRKKVYFQPANLKGAGSAKKPDAAPKKPSRSWSLDEKFIGENLLQYAGIAILALGAVFFLLWTAAHAGPETRVLIAAAAGAALILAGGAAERKPPYDRLAGTLIGGGWTVVYLTAYAAHHFPQTRVIASPDVETGLLLASAGAMVLHAVSRNSRPLRLYAVALTYFVMLFCGQEVVSPEMFLILFTGAAAVAAYSGEADVLLASLAGFYANFVPVFAKAIGQAAFGAKADAYRAALGWPLGAFVVLAALPLIPKARERLFRGEQAALGEAALALNAALFALFASSLTQTYFGTMTMPRAAALAAPLVAVSLLYARLLSRRSTAAGAASVVALALLAAAVFQLPDPMWKLLAWMTISCVWVWVGLALDQPVWRAAGLAMSALTFAFYAEVALKGADARRSASTALFVFAGLSYAFSRVHRLYLQDPPPWERRAAALWLHAGTVALVIGLWGVLDAAPFLCSLVALAAAGEYAAAAIGRADLWRQAALLELALCAYSFVVDYGLDGSVAGVPMRVWTGGVLLLGCGYLYLDGPAGEGALTEWPSLPFRLQRVLLSWATVAATAFAVYREFDGRLRLPVWGLGALGLYALGRSRREDHLKEQAALLAAAATAETLASYVLTPAPLLSPLSPYVSAFFWLSCAALIGGLALAKGSGDGKPGAVDRQAAIVFGVLPVVMGACFLAKELNSVSLTLAWTGLGITALFAGMTLGWAELRWPALGLLGLCVLKALFSDTANLPLPNRVASFTALGLVLLFASALYVRAGSSDG